MSEFEPEQDPVNKFKNRSGPAGEFNTGNKGKFTESQIEERLKLHAIALSTGSPTVRVIAQHWKEKFGIDITIQSEKEWRKHNRDRIEKKRMELIETGEISIPVISEEVLNNSMLELSLATSKLSSSIRNKAQKIVNSLDLDELGEDQEKDKKTKFKVKVLNDLCSNLAMLNKNITDQIESMFDFAGKIKIKDKQMERLVQKEVDKKIEHIQSGDVIEDAEVTEEIRNKFLKNESEEKQE